MSKLIIKRIDDADVDTVAALAERIWRSHYTPIIGGEQVDYMLGQYQSAACIREQMREGYIYYLAYCDGTPAGYCGVKPDRESESVFLSKLYVDAAFRRNGIARLFLDALLRDCGACKTVWLTVNKYNGDSINAYQKMGFAIVDSMVTDIGNGYVMDDYKMALSL